MRANWLSAAAALVLVATLGLKLAVQDAEVAEGEAAGLVALERSLAAAGFAVRRDRPDLPIVNATGLSCTFNARVLDPHAVFHDTELAKLPRGWSMAYARRGNWHAGLPRFAPLSDYFIARTLARVGIPTSRSPVVMVSLSPNCPRPEAKLFDIEIELRQAS